MELYKWAIRVLCGTIAVVLFGVATSRAETPGNSLVEESEVAQVRVATMRYYIALNSILRGDLEPMNNVWSHRSDVTNLSAAGDRTTSWNEVHSYYQNLGRQNLGGMVAPKDLSVVALGPLGYSVCVEVGQTRTPEGPMATFTQRATNIFRLEDGKWKLIHHHVDENAASVRSAR
jgi:ketosteroid isomerase-like protein